MATIHKNHLKLILTIGLSLLLTVKLSSCLQNIRIQVNNENYKSPPYLLEVIKQTELLATQAIQDSAGIQSGSQSLSSQTNTIAGSPSQSAAPIQASSAALPDNSKARISAFENKVAERLAKGDEIDAYRSHAGAKGENLEALDVLGLNSDSVLRLLPDTFASGSHPSNYPRISDLPHIDHVPAIAAVDGASFEHQEAANNQGESNNRKPQEIIAPNSEREVTDKQRDVQTVQTQRQPQLPVTSAHLKKPAGLLSENANVSPLSINSTKPNQLLPSDSKNSISPSVTVDESSAPASIDLNTKKAPIPPDTLAPEQIVDFSNVSSIPPLVKKEYGSNTTRTRITLGGGYIRDRQPPLVNPASSSYVDKRPEKPVVPLERTRPPLKPDSPIAEVSRVIDVPERIVVQDTSMMSSIARRPVTTKVTLTINNTKEQDWMGTPDSRCPKEGVSTFEHSTACDKYFYCEDGYISEETCPNGLMYGTRDTIKDYCVHRWKADCGDRSIPNPISSPGCRWQYGLFNVQGSPKCSQDYYECVAGKFTVKKCSIEGQVYVDATKSCQYAERVGCTDDVLTDFKCPVDDQSNTYWPFPRYFLNDRALIHCVNDKPQIVRCTEEERVDPEHLHCIPLVKPSQSVSINPPERRSRVKKKTTT